jgi:hypothetical protein
VSETALSKSIRKGLTQLGIWVVRVQSGIIEAKPYKGKKRFIHCAEPGTPDLLCPSLALWLEIKTPKGRLSPVQKQWHARAQREGVRVAVVHSLAEALEVVRFWQVETGQARRRSA